TPGEDAAVGLNRNFDAAGPSVPLALEADVLKNKSGKMLNGVQNGLNLQLHRWPLVSFLKPGVIPARNPRSAFFAHAQADGLLTTPPKPTRAVSFAGAGERRQRAVELQFAVPPVATRNGLAPPLRIGAPTNDRKHNPPFLSPTN